jgi:thiamine-phosphate pyrophosphorylase
MKTDLPLEKRTPIMCLTQDGLPWSHLEQSVRLCRGGARWIQLRMKSADAETWLATARSVVQVCREHGTLCLINDNVEVALASGAAGVHLGKLDLGWAEARRRLGPRRIVGGTVNNLEDALRASGAGCLDYVGIGPWRFTRNKLNLAPVLGAAGIRQLLPSLGALPAWVIGGVDVADLAGIRQTGAAGAAVSSALFQGGDFGRNHQALARAWDEAGRENPGLQPASTL